MSIVERKSKFTMLRKVQRKTSESVSQAIINGLKSIADKMLTITSDNGTEFSKHEIIAEHLKAEFYFAHPDSSRERGLNKNTNGLIRQYLKKRADISDITSKTLGNVMKKLTARPRKTLAYLSPNEIFLASEHEKTIIDR